MRNPLTAIADRETRWARNRGLDVRNAANIAVASRNKIPTTTHNLFTRTTAGVHVDVPASSSTVYSIVHRIASDVANQEWALQPRQKNARQATEQTDLITEHPMLDLWDRPNDTMTPTGRAFRQLCGMYLELLGEATILVVRAGNRPTGQPFELWPLRPDHLQPVPDPFNWLAGWIHTDVDGVRTPLRPDQVLQIKYPNPADPYRGLSPLTAALAEVESIEFALRWQRTFFEKHAKPSGIVTTDQAMTSGEFVEWVERWNQMHQGVENAGRVALLDRGTKWVETQMSMVDMQLTELVASNRDSIREAWGINKVILGQTDDVNRANALAAQQIYGRYTLADRVDLWAEAGNELARNYTALGGGPGRRNRAEMTIVGDLAPEDTDTTAKDRDSRIKAWSAVVKEGADPMSAAEAFGLPEIVFPIDDSTIADEGSALSDAAKISQQVYLGVVNGVYEAHEARSLLRETAWGDHLTLSDLDKPADPEPDPDPEPPPAPVMVPAPMVPEPVDEDEDED